MSVPHRSRQSSGSSAESDYTLDTGRTSGLINLNYMMYSQPDSINVYYGVPGQGGTLIYSSNGPVSGYQNVVVPYGPGPFTTITIQVNQGTGGSRAITGSFTNAGAVAVGAAAKPVISQGGV